MEPSTNPKELARGIGRGWVGVVGVGLDKGLAGWLGGLVMDGWGRVDL